MINLELKGHYLPTDNVKSITVVGFLRGGYAKPTGGGGRQHMVFPNFPKDCLKLKEFGEGASKILLCRSAIVLYYFWSNR